MRYNADAVEKAKEQPDSVTEDGIEEAFDVRELIEFCDFKTVPHSVSVPAVNSVLDRKMFRSLKRPKKSLHCF